MTDSVITFFPQAFYVAEDLLEPGYLKELQDRVYYIKDVTLVVVTTGF